MGNHNHTHNFTEQFTFSGKLKTWTLIAIEVGILATAFVLLTGQQERNFANLLLMAYYFTFVCATGFVVLALHDVS